MWALIKPSILSLLFGPSAWSTDSFRGALTMAIPGFAPYLPAREPQSALTWGSTDLAIVPATQTFDPLGPLQVYGAPANMVTTENVSQHFPAITSAELVTAALVAASRRSYMAQLQGQAATAQRRGDYGSAVQLLIKAQEA